MWYHLPSFRANLFRPLSGHTDVLTRFPRYLPFNLSPTDSDLLNCSFILDVLTTSDAQWRVSLDERQLAETAIPGKRDPIETQQPYYVPLISLFIFTSSVSVQKFLLSESSPSLLFLCSAAMTRKWELLTTITLPSPISEREELVNYIL